ncbi:hypothetical protein [Spirochaeta africana]|uniref:Type II secretory pathway, component PulK n=1 Tax=Spirochaeta africana (strain ATCC 700263 / DSM 8902 / Z-7692) TaxID=889378 RepID=H9UK51_SPIAZ|nr:hypothetical protein [Spirochaeta africana]AFG37894.1 hypothetical protein Spiaf_1837 [Spirochaeta africana DSM 8902]
MISTPDLAADTTSRRPAGATGSIAVWTLALMLSIAAAGIGLSMVLQSDAMLSQRYAARDRQLLYDALHGAIHILDSRRIGDTDSPHSPPMQQLLRYQNELASAGIQLTTEEISSRINPCWISPMLLEHTGLSSLLLPSWTPASLQEWRQRHEPGINPDTLLEVFTPHARDELVTLFSPACIHYADEFSLYQLCKELSPAHAGSIRSAVQDIRRNGIQVSTADLEHLLGPAAPQLLPWVTAEPLFNIHYTPAELLAGLLAHRLYAVPDPPGTLQRVLRHRTRYSIEAAELPQLLGIREDHRLLLLLGTTSRSWRITARTDRTSCTVVVMRPAAYPKANLIPAPPAHHRIVQHTLQYAALTPERGLYETW